MSTKKVYCENCEYNLYNYLIINDISEQDAIMPMFPSESFKNFCRLIKKDTAIKQIKGKCEDINMNNDCNSYSEINMENLIDEKIKKFEEHRKHKREIERKNSIRRRNIFAFCVAVPLTIIFAIYLKS